jgi:TonB family protein
LFGAAVSAPEMPEEVAEPAPPAPQAPKFPVEAALAPEFAEEAEFRPWPELESLPEADLSSETSSEPAIAPEARPDLHAPPSEPAAAPIESAPPAPAVEQSAAAPVVPPAPASAAPSPRPSAAPTREPPALFEELSAPPPRRDWATGFLTVVVIALALLLGWMLGRIGWEHTSERPKEAVDSPVVQAALPKPSPAAPSSSASQSAAESSDGNAPVSAAPILHPSSPREAAPAAEDESSSSGGLVIYEGGKIIFRQNALPNSAGAPDPERDPQPSSAAPGKSAVLLDFQTAGTYLVKQVQPVYPQEARRLRVQGEVVLEALVARNGAVEELELLSGDSRLATAAAEAIRQWRFKPYKPHGVPVNFRTRLMVNFRLPPG